VTRRILLTVVVALVAAGPAGARTATTPLQGVVVGSHQGVLLVAAPGGGVTAVRGHASLGARVILRGGRLVVVGHTRHARVRGVVIRRGARLMFLSAARHVLVVRPASAMGASAAAPGTVVRTEVEIEDNGVLREEDEQELADATKIEIEGVVAAVGAGTVTLTVNGQPLVLQLPAGVTLPASFVGRAVEFELKFAPVPATGVQPRRDDDDDDEDEHHAVVTPTTPTSTSAAVTIPATVRQHDEGNRGRGGGHDGGDDDGGHGGGDH